MTLWITWHASRIIAVCLTLRKYFDVGRYFSFRLFMNKPPLLQIYLNKKYSEFLQGNYYQLRCLILQNFVGDILVGFFVGGSRINFLSLITFSFAIKSLLCNGSGKSVKSDKSKGWNPGIQLIYIAYIIYYICLSFIGQVLQFKSFL